MAIIGVKYAYFDGKTCGKVTSVSATLQRTQLSALQQNKTITDGATISLVSIGGFDPEIFNTSGPFRWVTVHLEGGQRFLQVHEIENTVLQAPDISGTTKQESIDFATYSIAGQSWHCREIKTTEAANEADALQKAQEGWVG